MNIKVGDIKNVPWNLTKATFSVVVKDLTMGRIVVKDFRLVEGQNGMYVAGPSKQYTNKENETKYLQYIDLDRQAQQVILEKIQAEFDHTQKDYQYYGEQTFNKKEGEGIPF